MSTDSMSSMAKEAPVRLRVRTPGKHLVLFALGIASLVGAAAHFAGRAPDGPGGAQRTQAQTRTSAPTGAPVVALGEFLVDLAPDRSGRVAYLRLAAAIRAAPGAGAGTVQALEAHAAEIRERVLALLRGLTAEDLAGEEGLDRVKREILRRVRLVAGSDAADVVITDIIVQ